MPGTILTLAAASGLTWLTSKVSIPGRWLGLAHEHLRPGPAVWAVLIALLVINPYLRLAWAVPARAVFGLPYDRRVARPEYAAPTSEVLDLTDWSLYFSQRAGYQFADVYKAPADPKTRWIVVRQPHVEGNWHYSQVIRELIGGREAVAVIPPQAGPNQMQIRIYDRRGPASLAGTMTDPAAADNLAAVSVSRTHRARPRAA